MITDEIQQGILTEVTSRSLGSETAVAHLTGDVNLYVYNSTDFYDDGGQLKILVDIGTEYILTYTTKDDDLNLITLSSGLPVDVDPDTLVLLEPAAPEKWASVQLDDNEEPIMARIPYGMTSGVDEGIRDAAQYEGVEVQLKGLEYVVTDFLGKQDYFDGTAIDPTTLPAPSSSAISTAPVLSALAGVNSVFLTWGFVYPDTAFAGTVYYEVHASSVSGFTPDSTTLYSIGLGPTAIVSGMPNGSALSTSAPTYFKIRAFTPNQVSPWSNQASATALAPADPAVLASVQSSVTTLQAKFPINTVDIATGAVIASKITDGTITTAKIGNLQITAPLIADATITTAKYGAGSINTTAIGNDQITSALIAANTIVAADIAANTITASQIAANTITASQIAAGTITATQLAANSVTASQIASGAVTTNKLSVIIGGGNLLTNSSFENTTQVDSGWTRNNGTGSLTVAAQTGQRITGAQSVSLTGNTTGSDTFLQQQITVLPNTTYTFSAWRYVPGAITGGANGNRSIYMRDGSGVGTAFTTTLVVGVTTGVWVRESVTMTTQATTTFVQVRLYAPNGTVYWEDAQFEVGDTVTAYSPKPDEILPGTVVATMIAANTITASQIAASTITTNEIAANTIQAADIQALTITANEIAANTITAAKIAANTITASQIASGTITATQIASGTITATQLTATAIDGMTITGAIFQTASSGQRMTLQNDVAAGVIKMYTGLTSEVAGYINPDIDTSGGVGNYIPTLTMKPPTGNGFNVAPTLFLRPGGHSASIDQSTAVYINIPDSTAGAGGNNPPGFLWVAKNSTATANVTINADGTIDTTGRVTVGGNLTGNKVFTNTTDTSTSAANVRLLAGGQLVSTTSLTKHKISPTPISTERLKKLLDLEIVEWYDRAEVKENGGKKTGLHKVPGALAEDVEKIDPVFADHHGDKLIGVAYDRLGVAMLPLIKELYQEVAELKKEVAALKAA